MEKVIKNYNEAVKQYNMLMTDEFVNKNSGKWIAVSKHGDYVLGSSETRAAGDFIKYYPGEIQYFIGPVGCDPATAVVIYKK